MEYAESLQVLCNELVRRGLPRDYIERVTGELADHADDLAAAESATLPQSAARLGDPVRLADCLAREFRRRTFLGRHPWLTFVVLPAGAMIGAWLVSMSAIVLVVELWLALGGEKPSDAWRWAAAMMAGALAFGMTYGVPALLCWWALRKTRQTTHAWSWAWAATAVLVLTSFVFRIYLFRNASGQFCLDAPGVLRVPSGCLVGLMCGDALPDSVTFWRMMWVGSISLGYLTQVAVLLGATAFAIRQSRRALATLCRMGPAGRAEVA